MHSGTFGLFKMWKSTLRRSARVVQQASKNRQHIRNCHALQPYIKHTRAKRLLIPKYKHIRGNKW